MSIYKIVIDKRVNMMQISTLSYSAYDYRINKSAPEPISIKKLANVIRENYNCPLNVSDSKVIYMCAKHYNFKVEIGKSERGIYDTIMTRCH